MNIRIPGFIYLSNSNHKLFSHFLAVGSTDTAATNAFLAYWTEKLACGKRAEPAGGWDAREVSKGSQRWKNPNGIEDSFAFILSRYVLG